MEVAKVDTLLKTLKRRTILYGDLNRDQLADMVDAETAEEFHGIVDDVCPWLDLTCDVCNANVTEAVNLEHAGDSQGYEWLVHPVDINICSGCLDNLKAVIRG